MIVLSGLDMIWQKIPASGSTVLERFPIQLSIVQTTRALTDGHHRAMSGVIFVVVFDSLRIRLPSWDCMEGL